MKTKYKIKDLEDSLLLNHLPKDVFMDVITSNSNVIYIDDSIIQQAKEKKEHYEKFNAYLAKVGNYNNEGIEYEKAGNFDLAIKEYEKCMDIMYESIESGIRKDFAWHSPDRLRILYKKFDHPKQKEFLEKFVNFCNKYNQGCPDIFTNQLQKISK